MRMLILFDVDLSRESARRAEYVISMFGECDKLMELKVIVAPIKNAILDQWKYCSATVSHEKSNPAAWTMVQCAYRIRILVKMSLRILLSQHTLLYCGQFKNMGPLSSQYYCSAHGYIA